jgi:hypothetical protein
MDYRQELVRAKGYLRARVDGLVCAALKATARELLPVPHIDQDQFFALTF